jgi:DNA-binding NarL/FixJ family response regulator
MGYDPAPDPLAEERAGLSLTRREYDPDYAAFHDLMAFRVREVLLVSSLYDSYILEEDGLLSESLDAEYHQLNLSYAPHITQVSTAEAARKAIDLRPFDLVITRTRLGEMDPIRFAREVKQAHPGLPLVLLADNPPEANRVKEQNEPGHIDQVFVWRGDVAIFLAIIKYIEDRQNVDWDTHAAGVRVILLVENSVRFYSSYLPMLYREVMEQTQALMADGANARQRLRRMKGRPKVLLAETFEQGWVLFEKHRTHLLGVISDARFKRAGHADPQAGIEFVRRVKEQDPDMPALIQSSDSQLAHRAREIAAAFVHKHSPTLLEELRHFMRTSLGFGDFVFGLPDGTEVVRVRDLAEMARALRTVPAESLVFHASRNHFSNWCMARTEFQLASQIRPLRVSEFPDAEGLRTYLLEVFQQLRTDTRRGVVVDFSRADLEVLGGFARIGGGSMGGKGRGLGFINGFLSRRPEGTEGVRVFVPPAVVLGTEVFDRFLSENDLGAFALSDVSDEEINAAFLQAQLPPTVLGDLAAMADRVRYPLAVRSSSLLEDSHDQPFAGIYRTCMLPNGSLSAEGRLRDLCAAIKLVYASTFSHNAKSYLRHTPYRSEEEKMAVVIQKLVGRTHGSRFYPDFAGVARSYNYYPVMDLKAEDGIAVVALGFGKTVVEGGRSVRFSPGAPEVLPQFGSTTEILRNAQVEFYALDLHGSLVFSAPGAEDTLVKLDLEVAEEDGTLGAVGATWSEDNDAIYDGISRPGARLVTFGPMLKHRAFPLPAILRRLLLLGSEGMSCPVEIEFAVNLEGTDGKPEFALLQVRPMVVDFGTENLEEAMQTMGRDQILCLSQQALGHGRVRDIRDVVLVRNDTFDRGQTEAIATEVERLNAQLQRAGRPYLLIGPGRWGTSDRWLGIPVEWRQINGASAIVETDLDDVPVQPSEGTHFFQNLTGFGMGYFTVHRGEGGGWVDHAWLEAQPAEETTPHLRHIRLASPLDLRIDGRSRKGVVLKGEPGKRESHGG